MSEQSKPQENDATKPVTSSPDELVQDIEAQVSPEDAGTIKGGVAWTKPKIVDLG